MQRINIEWLASLMVKANTTAIKGISAVMGQNLACGLLSVLLCFNGFMTYKFITGKVTFVKYLNTAQVLGKSAIETKRRGWW